MSSSDEELAAFWAARLDEAEAAARHIEGSAGLGHWDVQPRYQAGAALIDARTGLLAEFPDRHTPEHIALHDPARALREVGADRDLLAALEQAREYSDRVFGPAPPGNIASGEWLSERMRAATQVLVLEQVAKIRAAVYSDHPDYQERWKP